jgi:ferredoxin-NADP reductase/mono/diheme cytochrome c family protein
MTNTSISLLLGTLFVLLGALNVWLIFHASRALTTSRMSQGLIQAHRLGGYLFIALFCLMSYFMALRTTDVSDELSMRALIHILVAMSLVPLLFIKVLIARYYKSYYSALTSLGVIIFCLAFLLVALTAGPYLLRATSAKEISPVPTAKVSSQQIDLRDSEALMQKKCSRCHTLDRVIGARKDTTGWLATVNRMRALPGSHISQDDATTILSYLVTADSIDTSTLQGELKVGKALVDSHCGRCHQLDRVYRSEFNPNQWQNTVARMVGYARGTDGFFKPGEAQQIIRFLSKTQTPEAVAARRLQNTLINPESRDEPRNVSSGKGIKDASSQVDHASIQTGSVILLVTVALGTLVIRRPKHTFAKRASTLPEPDQANHGSALSPASAFVLQLVRIERQTHDCVSLRFRLPNGAKLKAKPGQFMTFSWLLAGEKVIRSYTISSSPTQSGYIEITPKRAKEGFVSAFLNDDAAIGLTVEAIGPAGQFCFDERTQKKIVLVAAGSGITPMISILRFIDDRCLDTDVTLLYTARTQRDIIFEAEIERLKQSLSSFNCFTVLTRPEAGWKGLTGHIHRDVLADIVKRQKEAAFFLCGPEPFMNDTIAVLEELGVSRKQIKQERFGAPKTLRVPDSEQPCIGVAEFSRSGMRCDIPDDLTLLEVAEKNGITIPYSCRQGQCGTCVTRLTEGAVRMESEVGLSNELRAQGYILPCVSRARGDIKLDA